MKQFARFLSRSLKRILILIGLFGLLITVLVALFYFVQFNDSLSTRHEVWSSFGNYVGGTLSPILAFLALIALLLTIYYQNQSIKLQNFEHSFFEMLQLYNEIVKSLELNDRKGRSCFEPLFTNCMQSCMFPVPQNSSLSLFKFDFEKGYDDFMIKHGHIVGHYFRNLYRIFKFIDETDKTILSADSDDTELHNKKLYTGILRAQLSSYELGLLLLQSLFWNDGKPFKKYIEKYSLLENIDISIYKKFGVDQKNF